MTSDAARLARRFRWVLALLVLAAAASACVGAPAEDRVREGAPERPLGADQPDPHRDDLLAALTDVHDSLAAAAAALAEAQEAVDAASARRAGEEAVAALLAGTPGSPPDGVLPLLPAESPDRAETAAEQDALTAALTAARDAGSLGSGVIDLLRDPLAGDLGAWQRDAAGVVALVRQTATAASELSRLEQEILTLSGEGTRGLAWALLTAEATSLDDATAYAERARAHLDIVAQAVEAELEDLAPQEDG